MSKYAPYLRRMDGILLAEEERVVMRDQIKNAVDILEGVHQSLIGECVPRKYADCIVHEIVKEVLSGI
jgi:hypothetical protein